MATRADACAKWRRLLATCVDSDAWGQIEEAEESFRNLSRTLVKDSESATLAFAAHEALLLREIALTCELRANALGGLGEPSDGVEREHVECIKQILESVANGSPFPQHLPFNVSSSSLASRFGVGNTNDRQAPPPAATSRGGAVMSETGFGGDDGDDSTLGISSPSSSKSAFGSSTGGADSDDEDGGKGKRGLFSGLFGGGGSPIKDYGASGHLIPRPDWSFQPQKKELLTITVNRIGLKDASEYIDGRVRVVLRNKQGAVVKTNDFTTPISNHKVDQHIVFDHDCYLQSPFNEISTECTLFFEFIHFKALKKKLSCKAWSFMEMKEIRRVVRENDGDAVLELYAKPVDPKGKRYNLLSVKQLYLHVNLKISVT